MIVDDSIMTRNEIEHFLNGTNFEVICQCRNGEEALETYETVKPNIVTMDIIMPGMDGIETSKCLIERYPDAKIVIISSLAYDKTLEMVKDLGSSIPFVFKPIDKSCFIDALLKVAYSSQTA